MKIGFFGGTFDPLHIGHLILAAEGLHQLGFEHLEWILTPLPPHKDPDRITPAELRLEMLQLAILQEDRFVVSLVDLQRPAPHYTADTMEIIRKQYPQAQISYLVGEDSLRDLPNWYQPQRFLDQIDQLAVMERPGIITDVEIINKELAGLKEKVCFLQGPKIEISSTAIRRRIREGEPYQYFLLPVIYQYIQDHKLYQT